MVPKAGVRDTQLLLENHGNSYRTKCCWAAVQSASTSVAQPGTVALMFDQCRSDDLTNAYKFLIFSKRIEEGNAQTEHGAIQGDQSQNYSD